MTNLDVIKHLVSSNADLSDERLGIAAQLAGVDPSGVYVPANACSVYRIAIDEIGINKGVKRITESGYTIEFSDSSLAGVIATLAKSSGCKALIEEYTPQQPKIRNKSNIW